MLLYWDTENLKKGEYTGDLRIDYDERFLSKGFKINVNDNSMKFTGIGFVVSSEESKKISVTNILVIVIGILVLLNLIWFAIYMKNKKKK
jgi:preprotein translocase subunit Sec61beta